MTRHRPSGSSANLGDAKTSWRIKEPALWWCRLYLTPFMTDFVSCMKALAFWDNEPIESFAEDACGNEPYGIKEPYESYERYEPNEPYGK